MKTLVLILSLAVTIWDAGSFQASQSKARNAAPDPHRHGKFAGDVLRTVAPDIKIPEADFPSSRKRENVIENQAKTFRAFTMTSEDGLERIFVENIRTGEVYEIQGVPFPNRHLSDPVWVRDNFIFDRWAQPHYGTHYAFDMSKKVLVEAKTFSG